MLKQIPFKNINVGDSVIAGYEVRTSKGHRVEFGNATIVEKYKKGRKERVKAEIVMSLGNGKYEPTEQWLDAADIYQNIKQHKRNKQVC